MLKEFSHCTTHISFNISEGNKAKTFLHFLWILFNLEKCSGIDHQTFSCNSSGNNPNAQNVTKSNCRKKKGLFQDISRSTFTGGAYFSMERRYNENYHCTWAHTQCRRRVWSVSLALFRQCVCFATDTLRRKQKYRTFFSLRNCATYLRFFIRSQQGWLDLNFELNWIESNFNWSDCTLNWPGLSFELNCVYQKWRSEAHWKTTGKVTKKIEKEIKFVGPLCTGLGLELWIELLTGRSIPWTMSG